jgi:chemotaxis protein methyltransferase CheR
LESDVGKNKLLGYLRREIDFKEKHEERILKRLRLLSRKLKFKNYLELLQYFRKSPDAFTIGLDWLKRGKVFDDTSDKFGQLVDKKKKLTEYAKPRPRMQNSRQRRERQRRKAEVAKRHFKFKAEGSEGQTLLVKDPDDPENINMVLVAMEEKNINQEAYKINYIVRRLNHRMRRTGFDSYKTYANFLKTDLSESTELQKSLSINVTNFFRDKEVFQVLERNFLPRIYAKRQGTIKIWSAGCAVGAEPYSIAMIIDNNFSGKDKLRTDITASDISIDLINKAKERVYFSDLLRETENRYITKYFKKTGKDYRLTPILSKYIKFKVHDLQTEPPVKHLDLILCRNVLIYFSQEESESLFERFLNVLRPGGLLVIGKCEILRGSTRASFKVLDSKNRVYEKIDSFTELGQAKNVAKSYQAKK